MYKINCQTPSTETPDPIRNKLLHYRKNGMSQVLRVLLNQSTSTSLVKPSFFSGRTSPQPKDGSITQDHTFKQLDFSHLNEIEIRTPNLTPHSPLSECSSRVSKFREFNQVKLSPLFKGTSQPSKYQQLMIFFDENQAQFTAYLQRKDCEKMISLFQQPMIICQINGLVYIFTNFLYFLSLFMIDCLEYSKALFFLNNTHTLANLTRDHKLKVQCLISMAKCAKQFKMFDAQMLFIQKALMYVWANNYSELELQCYDELGLAFFYQGDLSKANYYHNKWTQGFTEPNISYYRKTSLEFIQTFERSLPTKAVDFGSSIQGAIGIPFINVMGGGQSFDEKRFIKYNNCNPIEMLNELCKTSEFKEFLLVHHEQQQQQTQKSNKTKFPKRILEITQKYTRNSDEYHFTHKILDNVIYKLPLQQQVNHRIVQSFSLEQTNKKVHRFVETQREPFQRAQQVYLRSNNKQKKEFMPAFIARYKNMLLQILK